MQGTEQHRFELEQMGLDEHALAQFAAYLNLLVKWNARMNLTSVRAPGEIVGQHFAECLFAAEQIPKKTKTLLDYGSGAGLPGIPIAICRPQIAVTLAESQGKKAAFLREAVRTLALKAEVWAARVEQMPPERVFDAVTLRAVEKMPEACRTAVLRLAPGASIAVFATRKTEPEIAAIDGIRWKPAVAIPGSQQRILMYGIRPRT